MIESIGAQDADVDVIPRGEAPLFDEDFHTVSVLNRSGDGVEFIGSKRELIEFFQRALNACFALPFDKIHTD